MYVTKGGGGLNKTFNKNVGSRIMRFQTLGLQIGRNGMEYFTKIKKIGCCALSHKLTGGCNSIKIGLRGMLTVFGCRNSNNLLIHQDCFLKFIFPRLLESFYRSCSVHVI